MSIKSDKWIKRVSAPERHAVFNKAGVFLAWYDSVKGRNLRASDPFSCHVRLVENTKPLITPFEPAQVRGTEENRVLSYGTSSYGYDVRCANEFKIFTNVKNSLLDPKAFDPDCFVDHVGDYCIIPPNSFVLARTVETFNIPRGILTICLGKSTYARLGIIVNVTPLEPEWSGQVVLEFSNTTNLPAKIYANEGVAQVLFLESDEECEVSYADRGGKYQNQTGITLPRT